MGDSQLGTSTPPEAMRRYASSRLEGGSHRAVSDACAHPGVCIAQRVFSNAYRSGKQLDEVAESNFLATTICHETASCQLNLSAVSSLGLGQAEEDRYERWLCLTLRILRLFDTAHMFCLIEWRV